MKNIIFIAQVIVFSLSLGIPIVGMTCTVNEIVDMVKDGSGYKALRDACNGKVDGVPRCSFKEVVQFAYAEKDEFEIIESCGLCETPTCETRYGNCSMMEGYGRIKDGGQCTCSSQWGNVRGIVSCNN